MFFHRVRRPVALLVAMFLVLSVSVGFFPADAQGSSERGAWSDHRPVTNEVFLQELIDMLGVQLYEVTAEKIGEEQAGDDLAPYVEAARRLQLSPDVWEVGSFNPQKVISREQAYVLYIRALNLSGDYDEKVLRQYRDWREVSDWARSDLAAAHELETISDVRGPVLQPRAPFTYRALADLMHHYDEIEKINIMHMNDLHGRVLANEQNGEMGLGKISTLIQEAGEQYEHQLVFDLGDTFHGTNYVNLNQGMAAVEAMNEIGFDAMVPGNHEFNYGLDRFKEFGDLVDFPLISANIMEDGEPLLEPYVILEKMDKRFAVVGLTATNTPISTHPDNVKGLGFEDEVQTAQYYVDQLEDEVDHIIFLTHIGLNVDEEVAAEVDGIDLIIGGHSHSTLHTPKLIGDTFVMQAFEHGKKLGSANLLFHEDELIGVNGHLLQDHESIEPDQEVEEILQGYKEEVDEALKEVIAHTDQFLNGARESVRVEETNLGNLIADSMRAFVDADIALQNGGGIRASMEQGDITFGDVVEVLPFNNTVIEIEMSGDQIKQALEHSVRLYPGQNGGFLQVSGLQFRFAPDQGAGSRVQDVLINGEPLEADRVYSVATNDFVAFGGDGYESVKAGNLIADTGELLSTVLIGYFKQEPQIPEVEGRIQVLK